MREICDCGNPDLIGGRIDSKGNFKCIDCLNKKKSNIETYGKMLGDSAKKLDTAIKGIKKPKPLIGKKMDDDFDGYVDENTGYKFCYEDVKSAVEGLIKYHEDNINKLIIEIESDYHDWDYPDLYLKQSLYKIREEYQHIMAIEHWLEDAI